MENSSKIPMGSILTDRGLWNGAIMLIGHWPKERPSKICCIPRVGSVNSNLGCGTWGFPWMSNFSN